MSKKGLYVGRIFYINIGSDGKAFYEVTRIKGENTFLKWREDLSDGYRSFLWWEGGEHSTTAIKKHIDLIDKSQKEEKFKYIP